DMLRHVPNLVDATERVPPKIVTLSSSKRKTIVLCFPQTQSHELLLYAMVDLRPERPHDVLAGGRNFSEIFRFKIKMSIFPRLDRFIQRIRETDKIVKRPASLVVIPANRCFDQIKVPMSARVIAFPKQFRVLVVRERRDMQAVCSAKAHLHSKKHNFVRPNFSEEIVAFMETNAMNRERHADSFTKIDRQAFRCNR